MPRKSGRVKKGKPQSRRRNSGRSAKNPAVKRSSSKRSTPRARRPLNADNLCPQCTAIKADGQRCQGRAACRKDPTETRCPIHRKAASESTVSNIVKVQIRINQVLDRTEHNESEITRSCPKKGSNIRASSAYKAQMKAFEKISAVLEHIGKPDMTGNIELKTEIVAEVDRVIDEFEAAEDKVHAMIEKQCTKAKLGGRVKIGGPSYNFDRMFEGMVKPTCLGQEMPPDMMEWYGKIEEKWTDKTVLCIVPTLAAHLMSKAGDFIMKKATTTEGEAAGVGLKLMGTPWANKIFNKSDEKLSSSYQVQLTSGPFVGVARPRNEDKKRKKWQDAGKEAIRIAVKIAHGMYIIVKGAVKFGYKIVTTYPRATLTLLTLAFVAIKYGVIPAGIAAPILAFLAYGLDYEMLMASPMAWAGFAAVMAIAAAKHSNMMYAYMPFLKQDVQMMSDFVSTQTDYLKHRGAYNKKATKMKMIRLEEMGKNVKDHDKQAFVTNLKHLNQVSRASSQEIQEMLVTAPDKVLEVNENEYVRIVRSRNTQTNTTQVTKTPISFTPDPHALPAPFIAAEHIRDIKEYVDPALGVPAEAAEPNRALTLYQSPTQILNLPAQINKHQKEVYVDPAMQIWSMPLGGMAASHRGTEVMTNPAHHLAVANWRPAINLPLQLVRGAIPLTLDADVAARGVTPILSDYRNVLQEVTTSPVFRGLTKDLQEDYNSAVRSFKRTMNSVDMSNSESHLGQFLTAQKTFNKALKDIDIRQADADKDWDRFYEIALDSIQQLYPTENGEYASLSQTLQEEAYEEVKYFKEIGDFIGQKTPTNPEYGPEYKKTRYQSWKKVLEHALKSIQAAHYYSLNPNVITPKIREELFTKEFFELGTSEQLERIELTVLDSLVTTHIETEVEDMTDNLVQREVFMKVAKNLVFGDGNFVSELATTQQSKTTAPATTSTAVQSSSWVEEKATEFVQGHAVGLAATTASTFAFCTLTGGVGCVSALPIVAISYVKTAVYTEFGVQGMKRVFGFSDTNARRVVVAANVLNSVYKYQHGHGVLKRLGNALQQALKAQETEPEKLLALEWTPEWHESQEVLNAMANAPNDPNIVQAAEAAEAVNPGELAVVEEHAKIAKGTLALMKEPAKQAAEMQIQIMIESTQRLQPDVLRTTQNVLEKQFEADTAGLNDKATAAVLQTATEGQLSKQAQTYLEQNAQDVKDKVSKFKLVAKERLSVLDEIKATGKARGERARQATLRANPSIGTRFKDHFRKFTGKHTATQDLTKLRPFIDSAPHPVLATPPRGTHPYTPRPYTFTPSQLLTLRAQDPTRVVTLSDLAKDSGGTLPGQTLGGGSPAMGQGSGAHGNVFSLQSTQQSAPSAGGSGGFGNALSQIPFVNDNPWDFSS